MPTKAPFMTCLSNLLGKIFLITISSFLLTIPAGRAQSILLIKAETEVYDTNTKTMVVKLRLKEETWVSYKGKQGNLVKISNFFGKDHEYPSGIFTGYVSVNSILDTAARSDYDELRSMSSTNIEPDKRIESYHTSSSQTPASPIGFGEYYLGMSRADAITIGQQTINLGTYEYDIDLKFNASGNLSALNMIGEHQNALAVDAEIKEQVIELGEILREKLGSPNMSKSYPSFLEIEPGGVFQFTFWSQNGKVISLGIGEENDLYYPIVIVAKQ